LSSFQQTRRFEAEDFSAAIHPRADRFSPKSTAWPGNTSRHFAADGVII
jgi:hypothetical protein